MSKKKSKVLGKLKTQGKKDQIIAKEWEILKETYKFQKVGIIKSVKFGASVGSIFGAFAWMMDGPFGLQLTIIEDEHGFPISWVVALDKWQEFFHEMGVNDDKELVGKPVLCLSNSEASNCVEKVVPHSKLLEVWKDEGR